MSLLMQRKPLYFLSFLVLVPVAVAVHADPILRAGNITSYIIGRPDANGTLYSWGFGRSTRNQMFKNNGSTTNPSNYTQGTKFGTITNNCSPCHQDIGLSNKDIASSKLMSHVLMYSTTSYLNKVVGHGDNTYGQLGNELTPDLANFHNIAQFPLGVNAKGIAAGSWSSYVIQGGNSTDPNNWTVMACGYNNYGQLGDGTTEIRKTMVNVKINSSTNLTKIVSVSAGQWHVLFLDSDGILWACGSNAYGQLGLSSSSNQVYAVQVATGVKKVEAGAYHTIIQMTNNDVKTTGRGNYGQLATGSTANQFGWQLVGTTCMDIAAGANFSIALKTDKTLYTSGRNDKGQLANGNTTNQLSWVQVCNDIDLIAGGNDHTLIWRRSSNTYWTCGNNSFGQCGTGTSGNYYTGWQPVQFLNE